MKILVYDVAAQSGGALTVLHEAYQYAAQHREIEWKFILSAAKLESRDNILVENYPDIKKSWFHRYRFDKITAPRIVQKFKPDIVLNLQNICISCKCKQILYMHQPLPFAGYRFSVKDRKMWIYQNIIGRMIKRSCKRADEIIVQTQWIKNAIVRQCKVPECKISVRPPKIDAASLKTFCATEKNCYFYPASASVYKNHAVIVDACIRLKQVGFSEYKIMFTLQGNENEHIRKLYEKCQTQQLNIEWVGSLPRARVYELYGTHGLIFPSYIETFGLPLLEAKTAGSPILASDTEFSHEICDGYSRVKFFTFNDSERLARLIQNFGDKSS